MESPPKTTAVASIEKRYSSGGGAPTHLPGAASPRGSHDDVVGRSETTQGWGDPKFKEQAKEMLGG